MTRFAIPSYHRPDTLCQTTIPLLRRLMIPDIDVLVFVTRGDAPAYEAALLEVGWGGEMAIADEGMGAARRSIQRAFPQGERFVQIDDDVRDLVIRDDAKTARPATWEDWRRLEDEAWAACDQTGAMLWGVYPVANPYFMKPRIRTDLTYIVGCLFGIENDQHQARSVTLDDKEDFERSLIHYTLDGAVVRVEWAAPVTRYYHEPGGMQVTRTPERVEASARALVERYPGLCTLNTTKASGHVEVRLRHRRAS